MLRIYRAKELIIAMVLTGVSVFTEQGGHHEGKRTLILFLVSEYRKLKFLSNKT